MYLNLCHSIAGVTWSSKTVLLRKNFNRLLSSVILVADLPKASLTTSANETMLRTRIRRPNFICPPSALYLVPLSSSSQSPSTTISIAGPLLSLFSQKATLHRMMKSINRDKTRLSGGSREVPACSVLARSLVRSLQKQQPPRQPPPSLFN